MATYNVIPDGVLDTADELRMATRRIHESLDTLKQATNAFVQATAGQTTVSFATAQQKWATGMDEMEASLGLGSTRLTEISHRYVRNDLHGAGLFPGGT